MIRSSGEKAVAKRKLATNIGRVCFVLAIVGIIALGVLFKGSVDKIVTNRKELEKYEKFILPVVMTDPVPFDDVTQLDMTVALQASMWDALLGENRENFASDENGMLLVPATDLDVSAHKLFGEGLTLIHDTFYDTDGTYLYDPDIMAYRVPTMAKISYTPYVESVNRETDKVVLKVGYIAPGNVITNVQDKNDKNEIRVDKYMLYDLVKGEDGFYISAIRDTAIDVPVLS